MTPAIPRKKLGSSDLEVPVLCLGTMTWGEQNTEEEAWEQLDYCLAQGLNFIDTAELYPVPPRKETTSRTESIIGRWLEARGCRDKVIIATKVAAYLEGIDRSFVVGARSDPPAPNPPQPQLDRANIRAALEASLRRLKTDYVDLYQLHWPNRYAPLWGDRQYRVERERKGGPTIDETVAAVGELIKEGKVRHWGLSNETTFGVCQFVEAAKRLGVPPPITIQNDFSLCCRHFEEELAEACAPSHHNISLLAYGVLAGGALTDKYLTPGGPPPAARHVKFPSFQGRYHTPQVLEAAAKYAAIAQSAGVTLAQLAQAWAAGRWYMGSVIIGSTTMEQLKENISAFTLALSQETLTAIEAVHVAHRNPQSKD